MKLADTLASFANDQTTPFRSGASYGGSRRKLPVRLNMPPFDPPLALIGDAPELHILSYSVQLNANAEAMRQSGVLNAEAARWTSVAILLPGIAAIIAAV